MNGMHANAISLAHEAAKARQEGRSEAAVKIIELGVEMCQRLAEKRDKGDKKPTAWRLPYDG